MICHLENLSKELETEVIKKCVDRDIKGLAANTVEHENCSTGTEKTLMEAGRDNSRSGSIGASWARKWC